MDHEFFGEGCIFLSQYFASSDHAIRVAPQQIEHKKIMCRLWTVLINQYLM